MASNIINIKYQNIVRDLVEKMHSDNRVLNVFFIDHNIGSSKINLYYVNSQLITMKDLFCITIEPELSVVHDTFFLKVSESDLFTKNIIISDKSYEILIEYIKYIKDYYI